MGKKLKLFHKELFTKQPEGNPDMSCAVTTEKQKSRFSAGPWILVTVNLDQGWKGFCPLRLQLAGQHFLCQGLEQQVWQGPVTKPKRVAGCDQKQGRQWALALQRGLGLIKVVTVGVEGRGGEPDSWRWGRTNEWGQNFVYNSNNGQTNKDCFNVPKTVTDGLSHCLEKKIGAQLHWSWANEILLCLLGLKTHTKPRSTHNILAYLTYSISPLNPNHQNTWDLKSSKINNNNFPQFIKSIIPWSALSIEHVFSKKQG